MTKDEAKKRISQELAHIEFYDWRGMESQEARDTVKLLLDSCFSLAYDVGYGDGREQGYDAGYETGYNMGAQSDT